MYYLDSAVAVHSAAVWLNSYARDSLTSHRTYKLSKAQKNYAAASIGRIQGLGPSLLYRSHMRNDLLQI